MTNINKTNILLVDDEVDFRQATGKALERRGYIVNLASSGEEALVVLKKSLPDLVLLDLKMEGISGIDTLKQVRVFAPKLPVIILTGHGGFNEALAGIKLEIVDFFQKPVDVELLDLRIRAMLSAEAYAPLRERTIAELLVSPGLYPKLYLDDSIKTAVQAFKQAIYPVEAAKGKLPATRSAVVYDRNDRFMGLLRFQDILRGILPGFSASPYSSFFTGMFIAQCKTIGRTVVADIMNENITVDIHTPLMEAVHLMVKHGFNTLPVMSGSNLVGILRQNDIVLEIDKYMSGGNS